MWIPSTLGWLVAVLALSLVGASAIALALARRLRAALARLEGSIAEHHLAVDRRCDAIDTRLRQLELQQRVGHLAVLLERCRREAHLEPAVEARLGRAVLQLAAEARLAGDELGG